MGRGDGDVLVGVLVFVAAEADLAGRDAHARIVADGSGDGRRRRLFVGDRGPSVHPVDFVEEHLAAAVGVIGHVAVVEHPVVAVVVLDEDRVVTRAFDDGVALHQHLVPVVERLAAVLVHIRSPQARGTGDDDVVGRFGAFAARAARAQQVVVAAVLDDVRALGVRARDLLFLRAGLHRHAVVGEFHAVDAEERAPEEVFVAVLLKVELVDGVLHAYLAGQEELAVVAGIERAGRRVAVGNADAAVPVVAPFADGEVVEVLVANLGHLGRPQAGAVQARRARLVGERRADLLPVHKVVAAEDGAVVGVFRRIKVVRAVRVAETHRVRTAATDDRVGVRGGHRGHCHCQRHRADKESFKLIHRIYLEL